MRELKDALRRLIQYPVHTLLAVGTLALGLSASTAVFTYVNAYRQSLPGAGVPDGLRLFQSSDEVAYGPISYPDYLDLVAAGEGRFEVEATWLPQFAASVRHEDLTEVVFGEAVSGGLFSQLDVEMGLGRGLAPEDDAPGATPVVVISHEYWVRRYGGAESAVGATILLNNRPHTIIGVAGDLFRGTRSGRRPEVWMPFEPFKNVYWARSDTETNREGGAVFPYLKLGPGVTRESAEEMLSALSANLDQVAPLESRSRRFFLEPVTWIHPAVRQAEESTSRIMVLAAVGLLVLACANVAGIMISSGVRRSQELSLRVALGASRMRLFRQTLGENLIIALTAGGVAILVAERAGGRLSSYFARPSVWGSNVPREINIDPWVLTVAVLAALATGVVTGALPALRASRQDPASALKEGGRWASGVGRGREGMSMGFRDLLVSLQIGLSVVLLFVAGLVLRTLRSASQVDPGFNVEQTLSSYISTSSMGTPVEERHTFYRELAQRFEELPWVEAATVAQNNLLSAHSSQEMRGGRGEELVQATVARVVPGFFEAMDINVRQGRSFVPADTASSPGVVVVNESLAERLAGEEGAMGTTLWVPGDDGAPDREFEVVGVVGDVRQAALLVEPGPVAYFSYPQHYSPPGNAFLVKVRGDPGMAVRQVEEELRAVDPRIAIVNTLPYSDVVDGFLYTQRMNAELFTIIAVLGLALTAAGVFGVLNLLVAGRRRELGVRLALGASRKSIVGVVTSKVVLTLLVGLALGLAGSFWATRMVESLLWGIQPVDPWSLGIGLIVLGGAVVLASFLPVYRALSVDPVGSLQAE